MLKKDLSRNKTHFNVDIIKLYVKCKNKNKLKIEGEVFSSFCVHKTLL